jgi:hypothetical protein
MRNCCFLLVLVLLLPIRAAAQETPKAELFGGYSYFHADSRGDLHGWHAAFNVNLNSWFGLGVDASGHYDSQSFGTSFQIPGFPPTLAREELSTNLHTVLIGPRFSYRRHKQLTPFGHVLIGLSRMREESETEFGDFGSSSFSASSTAFAAAIGGGLDVSINRRFALRLAQADYLITRFNGFTQHNARLSTGIVVRF